MQPSSILPFSILGLIVLSPIIWWIRPHRFKHFGWIAAIPPALITGWLVTQIGAVSQGRPLSIVFPWIPEFNLDLAFRLDGLALLFGLIIAGIGTAVALYTGYYFEGNPRQGYFYSLLYLFMASMLGIVWSDNLLALFVFWEGTSITSYLLIAFNDEDPNAVAGGRRAFLVTAAGGLAMLFGMVILGSVAGSYSISAILAAPDLAASPYFTAAVVLILIGAFTKSAQFPFHFWLPGAMSAPTPASAYLHSATMVKAGVYLLARMHPALSDSPIWFWGLVSIGGITMLLGATSAIRYFDIKALLAYATVSQLGILVFLLAFDSEYAFMAVAVGILAHALYKGPLFLIAGIIDHATGTRDLRKLSAMLQAMPAVGITALLAILSMAGIPPLFGFLAKETLLETFFQHAEHGGAFAWILLAAAAIAGAFFVGYSLTLLWEVFLRKHASAEDAAHVHHAPSISFVLGPAVLVALGTLVPFFLHWVDKSLLAPAASSIGGQPIEAHLKLWHGFTPVLMTSLAAIAVGVVIFYGRDWLRAILSRAPQEITGVFIFDKVIYAIYDLAKLSTRIVQEGTLASQASVVLLAAVVVLGYTVYLTNWTTDLPIDWSNSASLTEMILAFLAGVASIIVVRSRTRLNAIISLGIVGITVTLFYVFFSAPDLALTQLLVDVLTTVLLVLVFYRIPPAVLPPLSVYARIRNVIVSLGAGALGFFMVLYSIGEPFSPRIADYFLLNSAPLAHGANIVNVILVDFRGFDTMGEITVLAIAAVGGYALLRSVRLRPRVDASTPKYDSGED